MAFVSRIQSLNFVTKVFRTKVLKIENSFSSVDVYKSVLSDPSKTNKNIPYSITNFSTSVSSCFKLEIPYKNNKTERCLLLSSKPDLVKTTTDERLLCYEIRKDEDTDKAIEKAKQFTEKKKKTIKVRNKKNQPNKIITLKTRNKPYEKFEDVLIMKYVNQHGNYPKVFRYLLEVLNRDGDWKLIRQRYDRIKDNPSSQVPKHRAKMPFSKEEDERIVQYVELFGLNSVTLNRLSTDLQRNRESIRGRYKLISSNTVTIKADASRKCEWSILEDRTLIECYFRELKDTKSTVGDIIKLFETTNLNANANSSQNTLQRSNSSCWQRWNTYLLPILKTYHVNRYSFPDNYFYWKTDALEYIILHKIESLNDVDYEEMLTEVCPGQTIYSLKKFLNSIKQEKLRNNENCDEDDLILYKLADNLVSSPAYIKVLKSPKKIKKMRETCEFYQKLLDDVENAKEHSL